MYIITEAKRNPKTGELTTKAVGRLYQTLDSANFYMKLLYFSELRNRGLSDNNACDANGNSCSGGYYGKSQAVVYDYCDYAYAQLLEIAVFTITKI